MLRTLKLLPHAAVLCALVWAFGLMPAVPDLAVNPALAPLGWRAPIQFVPAIAHAQPVQAACTDAHPCRVRIASFFTKKAADRLGAAATSRYLAYPAFRDCQKKFKHWPYCVSRLVADNDMKALRQAFERSGITNVIFEPNFAQSYSEYRRHGIDERDYIQFAGQLDGNGSSKMYTALLNAMNQNAYFKSLRRSDHINIIILYAAPGDRRNIGISNSQTGNLLFRVDELEDALRHKLGTPKAYLSLTQHQNTVLHEVGHIFGANHDRGAQPGLQPCTHPTACAYANSSKKFCTIMGQWNRGAYPGCQLYSGGLWGAGWIEEYSHANNNGYCRTEGYTREKCGDARHDNVSMMRSRVARVAGL